MAEVLLKIQIFEVSSMRRVLCTLPPLDYDVRGGASSWSLKGPAPIGSFCKKYVNIRYTLNHLDFFGSVEVEENILKI